MADVFLSYKRDERAAVETIASRLQNLGLTVWFDASVSAGEAFNAEIDREARAAKAILVCWSPAARRSEWVNAEAMIGFEQKKLAACYVSGPDDFSAPTPFNANHIEDLRAWLASPTETHAGWRSVLRRIGKLCGRSDIETWNALAASTDEGSYPLTAMHTLPRVRDDEGPERRRESLSRERMAWEATEEAKAARIEWETYTAQSAGSAEGLFWVVAILLTALIISAALYVGSRSPQTQTYEEPIKQSATSFETPPPTTADNRESPVPLSTPMQLDCSVFAGMTADGLRHRFGAANIRTERLYAGEGEYYEPTVVFPDDPMRRLLITWSAETGLVATVEVQGLQSQWVGPRGLRLGQSVPEVEQVNGRPFQIYGWHWDGGGRIAGWSRGALTREPCAVFGGFRWPGDRPGLPEGSEAFPSDGAPMRAANPRLEQIRLDMLYKAEYPGSNF